MSFYNRTRFKIGASYPKWKIRAKIYAELKADKFADFLACGIVELSMKNTMTDRLDYYKIVKEWEPLQDH